MLVELHVERDAAERRHEDEQLEGLQRQRHAAPVLDREVGGHQERDEREQDDRCATAADLRPIEIAVAGKSSHHSDC